jgi:hypothetical protein
MHVGSHFVDDPITVVDDKFCKLRVQNLLKPKVKDIFPFFQISGVKLNVKFDKVVTFPGWKLYFQLYISLNPEVK